MKGSRGLIEGIRKITNTELVDRVAVYAAEVTAVDEASRTCSVTTTGSRQNITIENVKLMASVDDGVFIVPEVGSTVFVSYSTFGFPFVTQFSAVKKIVFVASDNGTAVEITANGVLIELKQTKIELTDGKIQFNGDEFDGLVKVAELTQKLNNLENKVNELLQAFNTHTHTGVTTGMGVSGTPFTPIAGTLTPTQQQDIENPKVTHG